MPQAEKKDLYKQTAERYDIPEELVADVGDFIFQAWAEWQRNPDNLRLNIKNLGHQIVRKKKINMELDKMSKSHFDYINEENNTFIHEDQFIRYQDDKEWYHTIINLRDKYKKYTQEKAEIRKIRNELQRPLKDVLEADRQQKAASETSKTYFKEP